VVEQLQFNYVNISH